MLLALAEMSGRARRPVDELRAVEDSVGRAVAQGYGAAVQARVVDCRWSGLSRGLWALSLVGFATGAGPYWERRPVYDGSRLGHSQGVFDDVVVLLGVRRGRVHG